VASWLIYDGYSNIVDCQYIQDPKDSKTKHHIGNDFFVTILYYRHLSYIGKNGRPVWLCLVTWKEQWLSIHHNQTNIAKSWKEIIAEYTPAPGNNDMLWPQNEIW